MTAPGAFDELWAKQRGLDETYPLLAHLLDSAAIAALLFRRWLRRGLQDRIDAEFGDNAESVVAWLVGIHDLGKANPVFQLQPKSGEPQWEPIRRRIRDTGRYEEAKGPWMNRWLAESDLRRHERVSALEIDGFDLEDMTMAEAWKSLPALGHHGFFSVPFADMARPEDVKPRAHRFMDLGGWPEARRALHDAVLAAVDLREEEMPRECAPQVTIVVSGIAVLADRLASSSEWVSRSRRDIEVSALSLADPAAWFAHQKAQAEDYVHQHLGLYEGWESREDAEADILAGRSPRVMQQIVRDAGGGLVSVMAPTGSGKTEAALLRHIQEDERLLFLLPTQATTNALMRRVQKAFANTSNVASLAHGLASVEDFYNTPVTAFDDRAADAECCRNENGGLYPTTFVRAGMSRLMASVSVATVDQGLKAGLKTKWIHLLLLSLANSHVVIDEVHTLDHYQTALLETVLQWLGRVGARVTLLTATLPSWQYRRLNKAYSGVDAPSGAVFPAIAVAGGRKVIELPADETYLDIRHVKLDNPDTVRAHVEWVNDCRSRWPKARIGVICNRVAWAQDVAELLRNNGHRVILLHSAMTSAHRQANARCLETELGPGGGAEGIVVVGTQAIEASLDIDLDILSTDLCPSTSLLQRAGRVWRREDSRRHERVPGLDGTTIHVVNAIDAEESVRYPYRLAELRRTAKWLEARDGLFMPADSQSFVDVSSVSYTDLLADDASDADYEQFAAISVQSKKAETVTYSVDQLLDPGTPLRDLHRNFGVFGMASSPDSQLLRTRDIVEESVQVILGDSSGTVPGAWTGTADDLRRIDGRNQQDMRTALAGSIPLRKSVFEQIPGETEDLSEAESIIGRYHFVDSAGMYDPFVGFRIRSSPSGLKEGR